MRATGRWDTGDERLSRRGVRLHRARDGTWTLALPQPRALERPLVLTATDDGLDPPLEFVDIVWPLTGGRALRCEPESTGWAVAVPQRYRETSLRHALADVEAALPLLLVDDMSPESVRLARSSVRRFRTHLRSAGISSLRSQPSWLGLRMLNDHLRDVRDLDIVRRTLPRLLRLAGGDTAAARATQRSQALDEIAGRERRRARSELRAELIHPRTAELLDGLGELGSLLVDVDQAVSDEEHTKQVLRSHIDAARERVQVVDDVRSLLELRSAVRRVRVVATSASPLLGDGAIRIARRALEVQDALGPIADLDKARRWLAASGREQGHRGTVRELTRVIDREIDETRDEWRGPWDRLTRRRVLRWL